MTRHVALLRGINVGGNNRVPMADLAAVFRDAGHEDVRTYINSGNVIFAADQQPSEADLETLLETRFGFPVSVLLRTHADIAATVTSAPVEFSDDALRRDVLFLKAPTTPDEALAALPDLAPGVDQVWTGPQCLYFARLDAQASRSRLNRIVGSRIYRQISIRNWNTTRTLLELLEEH